MRAHYNQIRLLLIRNVAENRPQISFGYGYFMRHGCQHFVQLLCFKLGLFLGGFYDLRHCLRADDRIGRREPDVHAVHFGAVLVR